MNNVIVIVGPTASGKSALAQEIALALDGEVVSADSMQVYRGLDIGTGKLVPSEQKVTHWGLDLVDPGDPYSAALFQEYARSCFKEIDSRKKRSILCGGTGFYVRAAIDAYVFPKGEQIDNPIREKYLGIANTQGAHILWELLHEKDPISAQIIPENDIKRVVRAFELLEDGTTYATQKEKLNSIPEAIPSIWIGLSVNPNLLRERIDKRVDNMIDQGLIEEVKDLLDRGLREGITADQAIGYKEIVAALDGKQSINESIKQIKIATHRYAKRQRTWFRKEQRIHWIDANSLDIAQMTENALRIISTLESESIERDFV